jgi:mRNA interferase RelE/StbE
VEIDTKAAREIRALPKNDQAFVLSRVEALAENPRPPGCVKLAGGSGLWRIRSGVYRIIYQVEDKQVLVTIIKVAHRRDVYRGL